MRRIALRIRETSYALRAKGAAAPLSLGKLYDNPENFVERIVIYVIIHHAIIHHGQHLQ